VQFSYVALYALLYLGQIILIGPPLCTGEGWTSIEAGGSFIVGVAVESTEATIIHIQQKDHCGHCLLHDVT